MTKGKGILLGSIGFCLIIVFGVVFFSKTSADIYPHANSETNIDTKPQVPLGPYVAIGSNMVEVELATTSASVLKGLSGRDSLAENSGMLFLFKKKEPLKFWMPDMHFPLDMIWIDDGRVLDITHDATNVFDKDHPVFYSPKMPVRYVLEVNAGFAQAHGIVVGDQVTFNNLP